MEKISEEILLSSRSPVMETWTPAINMNLRLLYISANIIELQAVQIAETALQQRQDLAYEDRNHIAQELA